MFRQLLDIATGSRGHDDEQAHQYASEQRSKTGDQRRVGGFTAARRCSAKRAAEQLTSGTRS